MAGISSKAAGKLENKRKFNDGTELSTDLDINWYETDFRSLDPQIGRFHQIDPLGELFDNESLYTFAGNNPVSYNDPWGLAKTTDSLSNKPKPEPKKPDPTPAPPPSSAGAQPLPVGPPAPGPTPVPSPGPTPVSPPGKIVPMFEPTPIPWGGILGRIFGTIGGILIPLPAGEGSSLPKGALDPYMGHGNKKENWNPHIVYEFVFTPSDGRTPILKYGISDEYKNSTERPELQLPRLQSLFGTTVTWHIYTRTINRQQAEFIERLMVTQHVNRWGYKPRDQDRPNPFKFGK